jgi:hypothetical protein
MNPETPSQIAPVDAAPAEGYSLQSVDTCPTILVLRRHDIERSKIDREGMDLLLNDQIRIIEYPLVERDALIDELEEQGLIQPGAVLIQSPFKANEYELADEAAETFALEKYSLIALICQHLGARKVTVKSVDAKTSEDKIGGGAKVGNAAAKVTATISHEKLDKFKQNITLVQEYDGGDTDTDSALNLLKARRLAGDRVLRNLIEARGNSKNPVKRHSLIVDLSRETTARLDIAVKAKVPGYVGLNSDFFKSKKEKVTYTLTLEVDF